MGLERRQQSDGRAALQIIRNEETWDKDCTNPLQRRMPQREEIVCVAARRVCQPGWRVFRPLGGLAHATAKMGIVGMPMQLAMEGRQYGIRTNSISPAIIETSQSREQLNDKEWADYMLGKTLLGRLGKPVEVANVALFLASDESSFVTGVDIKVDGGMTVW